MIVSHGGIAVDSRTVYQLTYEKTKDVECASYAMIGAEQSGAVELPEGERPYTLDEAREFFAMCDAEIEKQRLSQ